MQDGHVVRADGTQEWRLGGKLHRKGDRPARIHPDGTQEWWRNGQLHREGGQPARVYATGTHEWYLHGQLHREGDKPATLWADGTRVAWYLHDHLHRDGGKPARMWTDGWQEWWTRGTKTREEHVTDFRECSDRFALVRAVVAIGTAACVPRATGSAVVGGLLLAVQTVHCNTDAPSYHVAHEHAFLVALFL